MDETKLPRLITLAEAAERLGVHQDTLKTWEAQGAVRIMHTPGGHRRVAVDELLRLVSEGTR